jgi:orotate phosphoribosyltransferase
MGSTESNTELVRAINTSGCLVEISPSENGSSPDTYVNFPPLMRAAFQRSIILNGLERLTGNLKPKIDIVTGTATFPAAELAMGLADRLYKGYLPLKSRRIAEAQYRSLYRDGDTALLFDPASATGKTALLTANRLKKSGLYVQHIVTAVDRDEGARELLEQNGYKYHALLTLAELRR